MQAVLRSVSLWFVFKSTSLYWLTGTYCQQREVEAITEDVEGDDGKLSLFLTFLELFSIICHYLLRCE